MTKRLVLSYLAIAMVVLLMLELPLAVFYSQRELERLTADVERDATVLATLYEDDLEGGEVLDSRPAERYHARTGARVVIVDTSGITVVDTEQAVPRDFSTRPEIATALTGSRASGQRASETLGTDLVYVAVPVASGGIVHGALRLTLDAARVEARIHRFWWGLGAVAVVVLVVMALVGWLIARSVTWPIRRLNQTAARFARGDLTVREEPGTGPPELRVLAETMADMATRLALTLDEQRKFVADASHQLRTPLTALRLRLENLQTRLDDEGADELDAAIDEIGRLTGLVADLLQLARVDDRRTVLRIDLAAIVRDRVDTWGAVAGTRAVELRLVAPAAAVPVLAVPGAIDQILDNTLDNALNAAPSGSTVTIAIERGRGRHRLTISDEGPGLSDDEKAEATRRFWRGSNASTPGTGLGLPIAEALATASGGALELLDAPGGGLTVAVMLSAADAPDRAEAQP